MDAALIEHWNATVAAEDTVWHLGDFAVRVSEARAAALLSSLHGTKHLIAGNNDDAADPGTARLGQRRRARPN